MRTYTVKSHIMQEKEIISQSLLKILEITHVEHDGSLSNIVAATQRVWLRSPERERWEFNYAFENARNELLPYFDQLGMTQEIIPKEKIYDYGVILGTTINALRRRFAYLFRLYESGVIFKKCVIITGERSLDPTIMVGDHPDDSEYESREEMFKRNNKLLPIRADWREPEFVPATESEMAHMLFEQAVLPKGFRENVVVEFVDTPMQKMGDGTWRRPNTGDTIKLWLKSNPKAGTVLAISDQPYINIKMQYYNRFFQILALKL